MKRGLLDAGGLVLHALFGVATSAELNRFRSALQEIGNRQEQLAHAHNHLATVVNQTNAYIAQMAIDQQQLQLHVTKISEAIGRIVHNADRDHKRLSRLEIFTDLDRYMDVLDLAANHLMRQTALFHRQRSKLETGRLSRDLLSESQLSEIISQATGRYKVIQELEWYYQFLTVTPLWQESNKLLYKIELPLIAPRPYLLYNVLSHPVPITNSSYTIHVKLEKSYAIDTVSGNLFVPQKCIGHQPTVCQTGPEYGPTLLKCARGLLTNQSSLIKTCKVEVKDYSGEPLVKLIDVNQYAIASMGEDLVVRCPGRTEMHIPLPRGTHNVTCMSPCTITGAGWTITCLDRLYLTRRYVMPVVTVTTSFNFSRNIAIEQLQIVLPEMKSTHTPKIFQSDIASILHPIKLTPLKIWSTHNSLIGYINSGCIAGFWIFLALTYLRWRRWKLKIKSQMVNRQPDQLPLTHQPIDNEQEASSRPRTSIWPLLPPLSQCFNTAPIIPTTNMNDC
jgi:hypothetical protein